MKEKLCDILHKSRSNEISVQKITILFSISYHTHKRTHTHTFKQAEHLKTKGKAINKSLVEYLNQLKTDEI